MQTEVEIVREIRRVEDARTRTTSNALYRDYGKHLARLKGKLAKARRQHAERVVRT